MTTVQPEAAFQAGVVEFAALNGWLYYHPAPNAPRTTARGRRYVQNVQPGYPDLTLAHAQLHRLVFAELKTETGQTSTAQRTWLATLRAIASALVDDAYGTATAHPRPRLEVYVWRPSDWPDIERVLTWER